MHDPMMTPGGASGASPRERHVAVHVQGVVQGVGFRPFVFRIATARGLSGWVRNGADGVRIEVWGAADAVAGFLHALQAEAPPQACITHLETREFPAEASASSVAEPFHIVESEASGPASGRLSIPADLATCAECAEEIRTPGERRHRYPFANCTQCGPRYTLIAGLPYDRARTAMASFELCSDCAAEYRDPLDRRFHAQPIACPRCGPRLELLKPDGRRVATGDEALAHAAAALLQGHILALKGLGGFQLLVDATSPEAVRRLRARKRRPAKPFAVMFPDIGSLADECAIAPADLEALGGPQAPIVLVPRGQGSGKPARRLVANEIAPGNPFVGAMLPYTPLHILLLAEVGRPLVCTSGNLSEEPMCTEIDEARTRLGEVADLFLDHDRPILRPVDDSVVRTGPAGWKVLRRARGFAPLPVSLAGMGPASSGPVVLALGGHLKATVALAIGPEVTLSQHLGDLGSPEAYRLLDRTVADLLDFHGVRPEVVACDLHPDYASTLLAERLAGEMGARLMRVQHHQAHGAAVAAEHGITGEYLALTWDGTGLGTDGTLWGGEALAMAGPAFRRVATLRPFRLPGGGVAAREPRRSLLGLLHEAGLDHGPARGALERWFDPAELAGARAMLERGVNSPVTSSMGRLFDAVSALVGLHGRQTFEGQAAMALEFAAWGSSTERSGWAGSNPVAYPLPLRAAGALLRADWAPMLQAIVDDLAADATPADVATRFHAALAELAVAIARAAEMGRVVLAGGCFQNALLERLAVAALEEAGFSVLTARAIPPNDGGIALGQVMVARLASSPSAPEGS